MSAPEPRSPLAAFWPTLAGRSPTAAGLVLSERRCRLTEIAGRRGCEPALAAALAGAAWPLAPGRWLAGAAADRPLPAIDGLDELATCVDVSGAFVVLELAGPALAMALPTLCRLDLATMRPGDVARTPMAQVPVILAMVDAAPRFDLLCPSTFARHCAEALVHAAAPYGGAAAAAAIPTGDPMR